MPSNETDISMLIPRTLGAVARVASQSVPNSTHTAAPGNAGQQRRAVLAASYLQPDSSMMRRQAALRERARGGAPMPSLSDKDSASANPQEDGAAISRNEKATSADEAIGSIISLPQQERSDAPSPATAQQDEHASKQPTAVKCTMLAQCKSSSAPLVPACAHAGAAGSSGLVMSFAKDGNRLSLGRAKESTGLPYPADGGPSDVRFVAAGGHNIVIDAAGVLWTWGRNNSAGGGGFGSTSVPDSGQLGMSRDPGARESVAAPLQTQDRFVAADCGRYHSAAISTAGKLHTWGLNDFGQLGRPATDAQAAACDSGASCRDASEERALGSEPGFEAEELVAVAAGRYHTVVAAQSGAVYTTGLNFCGNPQVRAVLPRVHTFCFAAWSLRVSGGCSRYVGRVD